MKKLIIITFILFLISCSVDDHSVHYSPTESQVQTERPSDTSGQNTDTLTILE